MNRQQEGDPWAVTDVTSTPHVARQPSLVARCLTRLVRVYQLAAAGRPSPCRHVPSCSTYAIEAIEAHGAAHGSWLAVRRLGRCHPWGTSGYDPVPPPRRPHRHRCPKGSDTMHAADPMTSGSVGDDGR
ncbi:MAG: membrane protein insertion efficiency factor YidD [Actinobacteria bacterium]|nr:membrane protein insertion efficiency factor YidD [Actinomycetota bacterium]